MMPRKKAQTCNERIRQVRGDGKNGRRIERLADKAVGNARIRAWNGTGRVSEQRRRRWEVVESSGRDE